MGIKLSQPDVEAFLHSTNPNDQEFSAMVQENYEAIFTIILNATKKIHGSQGSLPALSFNSSLCATLAGFCLHQVKEMIYVMYDPADAMDAWEAVKADIINKAERSIQ